MADTDGHGLANWEEYSAGTDPLRTDTNGNDLSDLVDVRRNAAAANPDDDGDGVSDLLDAYPLDAADSEPAADPNDTPPPTIILTLPTSARPASGGGIN